MKLFTPPCIINFIEGTLIFNFNVSNNSFDESSSSNDTRSKLMTQSKNNLDLLMQAFKLIDACRTNILSAVKYLSLIRTDRL